jgi:hypothetical protein
MCDANSIDTHVSLVNGHDPHYFQDLAAMAPLYVAAAEVGVDMASGGLYGIWKSANEGNVSSTALGLADRAGLPLATNKVLGCANHAKSLFDASSQSLQMMKDARK